MMEMAKKMDHVRGSGNVFHDLDLPDADTELMKARLAAEIIAVLNERKLSARAAGKLVDVAHSDIVNIRNAKLKGFSVERLVRIVNALDRRVELQIRKTANPKAA